MRFGKILAAAVLFGATAVTAPVAVQAAPLVGGQSLGHAVSNVDTVQFRRGYGGRRYGRRGGGFGTGAAIGLATGAIIGGAIASSQARGSDAYAYCSQRFRSYDPASGTYVGSDGARRACP